MTKPELSERERELLEQIALGHSNAAAGRQLHITEDTVKTHLRRMFRKLGVHDRAHAVAVAYQHGLLDTPPPPPAAPRTGPGSHASVPEGTRSIALTVTDHDAELLRAAIWPGVQANAAVQRQRVLDGLRKLAGT